MSSEVKCTALKNAIASNGSSIPQVAQNVGIPVKRVEDIFGGRARPTQQELDNLARSLDLKSPAPHDSAHTTA